VHVKEGLHLCTHVLVAARLEAVAGLRVAVHGVAHPGHNLHATTAAAAGLATASSVAYRWTHALKPKGTVQDLVTFVVLISNAPSAVASTCNQQSRCQPHPPVLPAALPQDKRTINPSWPALSVLPVLPRGQPTKQQPTAWIEIAVCMQMHTHLSCLLHRFNESGELCAQPLCYSC
jgi:hypothetical protein